MSTNPEARAWIQVRADALRRNYAYVRDAVGPETHIVPMVKADAYGLGMDRVVEALEPEGPWGYGVAVVEEGMALQDLGVDRPIVVLSPIPPGSVETAVSAGLQVTLSSLESLRAVEAAGDKLQQKPQVHVEVDTGMGRSGFDWREATLWLPEISEAAKGAVEWVGCSTHLHSADENAESVREQWARMTEVLEELDRVPIGLLVHVLNSAGAIRLPEFAASAVRPGIFLYGGAVGEGQPTPETVVSIHARVVHLREAPEGTTLGYGSTYQASGRELWATLSIGYGDGLPRALGNRGFALIGGGRVPIIGRISMDVTVVNITDVPDVRAGDVATLVGTDGEFEISLDDVAGAAGTISYEVLTGLTPRLPRVWTGLDGF
jgi:alanine racemase